MITEETVQDSLEKELHKIKRRKTQHRNIHLSNICLLKILCVTNSEEK